jgi:hypothetical protein
MAQFTERRRAIRYFFEGAAEVTELESGRYLVSETTELAQFGCFVKTRSPFRAGVVLSLKITHSGTCFAAFGRVAYVLPERGIGIGFEIVSPENQTILNMWLPREFNERQLLPPSTRHLRRN